MRTRVDDVGAAADDGEGDSPGFEGSAVGRSVDPDGEAAHHRHAVLGKATAEVAGDGESVSSGVPGADDGNRGRPRPTSDEVRGECAAQVEPFGRVGDLPQGGRPAGVGSLQSKLVHGHAR